MVTASIALVTASIAFLCMNKGAKFAPYLCVIIAPSIFVLEAVSGYNFVLIILEQIKISRDMINKEIVIL